MNTTKHYNESVVKQVVTTTTTEIQLTKEMVGLDNYENESKKDGKKLRRKHHRHIQAHAHIKIDCLTTNTG